MFAEGRRSLKIPGLWMGEFKFTEHVSLERNCSFPDSRDQKANTFLYILKELTIQLANII